MGGSFFAPLQRLASHDPLAGALNLPGSHTYANYQNQRLMNSPYSINTPYQGAAATLAGANAGYQAGGPGANVGSVNAPITKPYIANPVMQGSQTINPYAAAAGGAVPQAPRQQSTWGG
jgi:hypothetical protein